MQSVRNLVLNQVYESAGISFTDMGWQAARLRAQAQGQERRSVTAAARQLSFAASGSCHAAGAVRRGLSAGVETVPGHPRGHPEVAGAVRDAGRALLRAGEPPAPAR